MQVRWEYQSDTSKFEGYGPEISAKIEAAYLKDKKGSVDWEEEASGLYRIDFNTMTESPVRHSSSKSKTVRRNASGIFYSCFDNNSCEMV